MNTYCFNRKQKMVNNAKELKNYISNISFCKNFRHACNKYKQLSTADYLHYFISYQEAVRDKVVYLDKRVRELFLNVQLH